MFAALLSLVAHMVEQAYPPPGGRIAPNVANVVPLICGELVTLLFPALVNDFVIAVFQAIAAKGITYADAKWMITAGRVAVLFMLLAALVRIATRPLGIHRAASPIIQAVGVLIGVLTFIISEEIGTGYASTVIVTATTMMVIISLVSDPPQPPPAASTPAPAGAAAPPIAPSAAPPGVTHRAPRAGDKDS